MQQRRGARGYNTKFSINIVNIKFYSLIILNLVSAGAALIIMLARIRTASGAAPDPIRETVLSAGRRRSSSVAAPAEGYARPADAICA